MPICIANQRIKELELKIQNLQFQLSEESLVKDKEEEDEKPRRRTSRKAKVEKEVEDDETEEDEKPRRRTSKKTTGKATRSKKKDDECPEGYVFGEEWDMYDECDDCPLNDKCGDLAEELQN